MKMDWKHASKHISIDMLLSKDEVEIGEQNVPVYSLCWRTYLYK